jgi:argininosuccinate lyase
MGYMWGGRFKGKIDSGVVNFTSSLDVDRKLALYDIIGSTAHAKMLVKCGIISANAGEKIAVGLARIKEELENNRFIFKKSDEDIHTAVERRLIEITGKDGERLHTARSRNDQIVLDEKLFLKDVIKNLIEGIVSLQKTIVVRSKDSFPGIIPAYTHLQQSQPVLLSHYLLAYVEALERDKQRFKDAYERMDVLPAGVCACCGTSLNIDRKYLAGLLGFSKISKNSLDTVASRDFLVETSGDCVILMLNLSRLSEDLIIWNTSEFSFVELPDTYCTGSSIMPQKKNPDVLEIIRGKASSSTGMFTGLLTLLKGLPMSYNRDLQEDKRMAFGIFEDAISSLHVIEGLMSGIVFDKKVMEGAVSEFTLTTDIAEYLVRKGVPFRQAHRICGAIVRYCLEENKSLHSMKMNEWKRFSPKFAEDIKKILDFRGSVNSKISEGGTAQKLVKKEILRWEKALGI